MERPSRMAVEPLADPWMFMSRVIVEDGVDRLSRRNLLLDGVQKADELLTRGASGQGVRFSRALKLSNGCFGIQGLSPGCMTWSFPHQINLTSI